MNETRTPRLDLGLLIQRKDLTSILPNGILEEGQFTPENGGLCVHMRGYYSIGELKAILEDLIYCDSVYQSLKDTNS